SAVQLAAHQSNRVEQVRVAQVRVAQVHVAQVCAAQVCAAQVRVAAQVRAAQVRAAQVRAAQVRAAQVRAAQVRAAQVRAAQVRAGEVDYPAVVVVGISAAEDDYGRLDIQLDLSVLRWARINGVPAHERGKDFDDGGLVGSRVGHDAFQPVDSA